jgi:hypothetical protein
MPLAQLIEVMRFYGSFYRALAVCGLLKMSEKIDNKIGIYLLSA